MGMIFWGERQRSRLRTWCPLQDRCGAAQPGGRKALPSQMGTFLLHTHVKGLRFMKKRIKRSAQVVKHTKKSKVFGEHLLCSGTSQIFRVWKPKVESLDSNLCMAQKKMCGICNISISSHITSLLWGCSPGVPLALNMSTVLGWKRFFKCCFLCSSKEDTQCLWISVHYTDLVLHENGKAGC